MRKMFGKVVSIALCACMAFGVGTVPVRAAGPAGEMQTQEGELPSWYNELEFTSYEEAAEGAVKNPGAGAKEAQAEDGALYNPAEQLADGGIPTFSDKALAAEYLKKCIKERREQCQMIVRGIDYKSQINDVYTELTTLAWADTADPYEGDYMRWHMASMGGGTEYNVYKADPNRIVDGEVGFTINLQYLTTYAQEQQVRGKINNLLQYEFADYADHTEAYNIKQVYDWVCNNYTYDWDLDYFSAYAGMFFGETVCQGYSTTVYALLKNMGVSTRVIASSGLSNDRGNKGLGHGWNIVCINGLYYNLDATWGDQALDAKRTGIASYYFLTTNAVVKKGDQSSSQSHTRRPEYDTAEFNTTYPMATENYYYDEVAEANASRESTLGVAYTTHVQSIGWQGSESDPALWMHNGEMAGTSGRSLRLEAIKMALTDVGSQKINIEYKTHIQSIGWESTWRKNGEASGTSGRSLRLEAIRILLTGADAGKYDVYYRVHAQNYGWLDWAKNGEVSGTSGQSLRLEGIQVVVVKQGASLAGVDLRGITSNVTGCSYVEYGKSASENSATTGLINYTTHVQTYGWEGFVADGSISGSFGESKRLEGIKINLGDTGYAGYVRYRTHVQRIGWQNWVVAPAMSGTSGMSLRLEAIQIELVGEVKDHYDVYYRVHAQTFGWLGWACNGGEAGTAGYSKRLEAIQIVLVPKKGQAPNSGGTPAYVCQ